MLYLMSYLMIVSIIIIFTEQLNTDMKKEPIDMFKKKKKTFKKNQLGIEK